MHEYAGGHTVAEYPGESLPALLRIVDQPPDQEHIQRNHDKTAEESPFLADGAEDEVRTLFRHESESGLGAVQEALAGQAP